MPKQIGAVDCQVEVFDIEIGVINVGARFFMLLRRCRCCIAVVVHADGSMLLLLLIRL